jgi:alkylation response protein AidB-like acyl-CoA dehydrogenase
MENKCTDLRDTRFVLYEQLGIEDLCSAQQFQDHSRETFDMILDTAEKLAVNEFAPVNMEGDTAGCVWENGAVKAPAAFHAPFRKYCEGGWMSLPDAYDFGGQNAPVVMNFACYTLFYAANASLAIYMGLFHSAGKLIEIYGTDAQKKKYMQPLYEGRYGGTMVLTEPQAGSDVGATRANTPLSGARYLSPAASTISRKISCTSFWRGSKALPRGRRASLVSSSRNTG